LLEMATPKVEIVTEGENYGRFKIEPLEPGYGITLGNALRRILLSSLEGAAIVAMRTDGVFHEFSTMQDVKEDLTEIVLNVKRIRLRSFSDRPVHVHLRVQGDPDVKKERKVLAGDMELPSDVELINPDQLIATLGTPAAKMDMELVIEQGRGYSPAEAREGLPIGMIPVDAIFTPVPKVNFVVEHTRIGQVTDYDRLIVEIWSDGSVEPADALSRAAEILGQHVALIAGFNKQQMPAAARQTLGVVITPEASVKPIDDLDLSVRTYNCLKRANITKVGQLLAMDEKDLLAIRNFGRKSLDELTEKLAAHGYMPSQAIRNLTQGADASNTADEGEGCPAPEDETAQPDKDMR
jgi:DNA-directed RNA polymerase subunit alpha